MRPRHLFKILAAGAAFAAALATQQAQANPTVLFDLDSGRVLEHQDAFKRWYPASLTKLMTAYVAFKAIADGEVALSSPIRMTKLASSQPPSKMGFKPGSVLRLDTAVKVMITKSANDVAMAIGENIGGSQEDFAVRMNATAARLGMSGTHFVNPNGLFSPDQYTTARDIALLVTALRRDFPQYQPWFSIEGLSIGKKKIPNYNLLVGRYPGATGMKTGFVCPSGYNMVGTATRNGRTLAAVVLGEKSALARADAAAKLLDQGFGTSMTAAVNLAALQPYGDTLAVNDMQEEVCKKQPKEAQSEAAPAADANAPKSPWREKLVNPKLLAVSLGGATGPVPRAMIGRIEVADTAPEGGKAAKVPVPAWRPDRPVPVIAAPVAAGMQGDQPVKVAN
ncbi:D-alanyl-D-alanine carboxypeptidase family protein [Mesorhizobium sp. 1M-11]|uniref:D-alanyl-D-alanine carboxypeptidase family protein n=1 Tax=Mesorhizobium sp. 1M-11 TaxID=1529006 RepID=UPI0006C73B13|nr:D-alanyl-D-alanine carboxypeptidase family protein [Mesorhizobium sp. 1M-11]